MGLPGVAVSELESHMNRTMMPFVLIAIGLISIAEPMRAIGNCGQYPMTYVPSECYPPIVFGANPPMNASCMYGMMGGCTPIQCNGSNYENVQPARCGPTIISESGVPRCEENFATTGVQINQYSWSCSATGCICTGTRTGINTVVQICNCRNLTPLP